MLSKKMAFSLMGLITIMALAFAVSPAMAEQIGIALSYDEAENVDGRHIDVILEFSELMALTDVQAAAITVRVVYDDFSSVVYTLGTADATRGWLISPADFTATDAAPSVTLITDVMQKDIDSSTTGPQHDGRTFTFRIVGSATGAAATENTIIPRAAAATDSDDRVAGATRVYVSVPAGIRGLDPSHAHVTGPEPVHGLYPSPRVLDIPVRTVAAAQDRDIPTVVSIQRLRPGSQTVVAAFQEAAVTGPFMVRIVLSEEPVEPDKFADKIKVVNGTKSGFIIGTPFAWHGEAYGADPLITPPTGSVAGDPNPGRTIRPHPIEGALQP